MKFLSDGLTIVYIVVHGEYGEGMGVSSVWSTKEAATRAALESKTCFDGGWIEDGPLRWRNGCDRLAVEKWAVGPVDGDACNSVTPAPPAGGVT